MFPAPGSLRACGFSAVRRSSGNTKRSGRQLAAGRILQKPRPHRARCSACARCLVAACHLRSSICRRLHHPKGQYEHGKRPALFAAPETPSSLLVLYACTTRRHRPCLHRTLHRPIPNRNSSHRRLVSSCLGAVVTTTPSARVFLYTQPPPLLHTIDDAVSILLSPCQHCRILPCVELPSYPLSGPG